MTGKQKLTPTRRAVLSAIGTGLTAGLFGTEATAQRRGGSQYALELGNSCVPVQPIRGQLPADEFYDFQLPEQYVTAANGAFVGDAALYSSAGTRDLQRAQTSIAFLYRGPGGLSLVVVHGSVGASDAGAVTFRISGLPEDGEWIVKDDFYLDPDTGNIAATNYDRWFVDGPEHRIDWTWGSAGTDGGVFGDLGDDFDIVIRPAFNEAATLYGEQYEGTVTDWEFLSGPASVERVSLSLDEPVRIRTGSCEGDTASGRTGQQTAQQDQETEQQKQETVREQDQEKEREGDDEGRGNGHGKPDDDDDDTGEKVEDEEKDEEEDDEDDKENDGKEDEKDDDNDDNDDDE